ncbi:MAG: hypothetical protein IJR69_03630 [Bacteroidaceae bacterium]|nr:hypothetical protein [Bacteroidaceae bacterium]
MAKFIIRDSKGHVEKIVDKKMHRERKSQGGGGYGCLFMLLIVVGLIIYFSFIKDKNQESGETLYIENIHHDGKKKTTVTSRHLKESAKVEEDSIPVDTSAMVPDVINVVVDNVVQDIVLSESPEAPEPPTAPESPTVIEE